MTKNCKYMRTKYNWTPNDYDLEINHNQIPSNIILEDVPNLSNRLQKLMPLSKAIHLKLDEGKQELNSTIDIVSELSLTVNNHVKRVDII
ncbi:MAG: hypothetical protein IJQ68_10300 [Methanobrevibacter sp.]|uniref:hypothetical protein n=1 Tax=Methanobrevibacter sp. TaxID=66852 RepID=UPI0025CE7EDA|nr:hypothetical protein [Methanobrevibacter sp.]MBR0272357.1 hypothetical protein [Methanobrevibacter sp.]